MCTGSWYRLIIYLNGLLTLYLIIQIIGLANEQEFWFRRVHLKSILCEPFLDLTEVSVLFHDIKRSLAS